MGEGMGGLRRGKRMQLLGVGGTEKSRGGDQEIIVGMREGEMDIQTCPLQATYPLVLGT